MSSNRISIGNAEDFAHGPTRGWFIGNFLDPATADLTPACRPPSVL